MLAVTISAAADFDQIDSVQPTCSTAVTDLADAVVDSTNGLEIYDSRAVALDLPTFESQVSAGVYAELERRIGGIDLIGQPDRGMVSDHRIVQQPWPDSTGRRDTVIATPNATPVSTEHQLILAATGRVDCQPEGSSAVVALWRSSAD